MVLSGTRGPYLFLVVREGLVTLLDNASELIKEGQHDLAESHYRGIVDAMPDNVEAWMEFGRFERLRQRLPAACQYFEKAHSLTPADPEILAQLASTYAHVDQSKCKQYFHEFLQYEQDAQRIYRISLAILHAGLTDVALEGLMLPAVLSGGNSQAHITLGEACMKLRRYREAAEAYKRALQLDPNSLVCAFNLGRAYQKLEDDQRAVEYYRKAIDIFEQTRRPSDKVFLANTYEAISRAYIAVGNSERAIQLLEESIAIAKELPNARIFSSSTYESLTQSDFIFEASERLQRIQKHRELGFMTAAGTEPPVN
jgi:tetratricopeptide (TPR) repeat protein